MKTATKVLAILAAVLVAFTGCTVPINTASGTPIDPEKLSQIVKGVTTRQQVESLFGPCMNVVLGSDGKKTMYYHYSTVQGTAKSGIIGIGRSGEVSARNERLQIALTKAGIVEDFEFTDSTQETKTKNGLSVPPPFPAK